MKLKSMSIEKLSALKSQVDAALSSKVVEHRRTVEAELQKLSRLAMGRAVRLRGGVRGPVAPKYRNPANPSETWAGRGLKPRWLVAALKGGKKLEHFSIAGAAKPARKKVKKKPRKVARKARAARKAATRARRTTSRPRVTPAQSAAAPVQA